MLQSKLNHTIIRDNDVTGNAAAAAATLNTNTKNTQTAETMGECMRGSQ